MYFYLYIVFEVLTAAVLKSRRLYLQGQINRASYQRESRWSQLATCFHPGIMLGLFDSEDGGDMFLRNVG
jgi:hypothetical protein